MINSASSLPVPSQEAPQNMDPEGASSSTSLSEKAGVLPVQIPTPSLPWAQTSVAATSVLNPTQAPFQPATKSSGTLEILHNSGPTVLTRAAKKNLDFQKHYPLPEPAGHKHPPAGLANGEGGNIHTDAHGEEGRFSEAPAAPQPSLGTRKETRTILPNEYPIIGDDPDLVLPNATACQFEKHVKVVKYYSNSMYTVKKRTHYGRKCLRND